MQHNINSVSTVEISVYIVSNKMSNSKKISYLVWQPVTTFFQNSNNNSSTDSPVMTTTGAISSTPKEETF